MICSMMFSAHAVRTSLDDFDDVSLAHVDELFVLYRLVDVAQDRHAVQLAFQEVDVDAGDRDVEVEALVDLCCGRRRVDALGQTADAVVDALDDLG